MATAAKASEGILGDDQTEKREEIIELLKKAYWMEIETVMSYIANSVNPDGVRAQEIKESLETDIQEELGHAKQFAERIKELYGVVPGSEEFAAEQSFLQPPEHQTDIVHIVKGVIEAETGAKIPDVAPVVADLPQKARLAEGALPAEEALAERSGALGGDPVEPPDLCDPSLADHLTQVRDYSRWIPDCNEGRCPSNELKPLAWRPITEPTEGETGHPRKRPQLSR